MVDAYKTQRDILIGNLMNETLKCARCGSELEMTFGAGRIIATMRAYCPQCAVSHWATTEEVFWFGVKYGLDLK